MTDDQLEDKQLKCERLKDDGSPMGTHSPILSRTRSATSNSDTKTYQSLIRNTASTRIRLTQQPSVPPIWVTTVTSKNMASVVNSNMGTASMDRSVNSSTPILTSQAATVPTKGLKETLQRHGTWRNNPMNTTLILVYTRGNSSYRGAVGKPSL